MYNLGMEIKIKSKVLKAVIVFFPLAFTLFMYWLRKTNYPIYEIIGREDHIIEYSQFFFFLLGGILSLLIAFKFRTISTIMFVLFLFAALGLIGIAGEEISWGERIFNISAPDIFHGDTEVPILGQNLQGEMNLHNFEPIHNIVGYLYLITGSYLIFSFPLRKLIEKYFKIKKEIRKLLIFLTPPPLLTLYFFPVVINLFNIERFGIAPQDFEVVEFLFSLGILIFLVLAYLHISYLYPFLKPSPKGKNMSKNINATIGCK